MSALTVRALNGVVVPTAPRITAPSIASIVRLLPATVPSTALPLRFTVPATPSPNSSLSIVMLFERRIPPVAPLRFTSPVPQSSVRISPPSVTNPLVVIVKEAKELPRWSPTPPFSVTAPLPAVSVKSLLPGEMKVLSKVIGPPVPATFVLTVRLLFSSTGPLKRTVPSCALIANMPS